MTLKEHTQNPTPNGQVQHESRAVKAVYDKIARDWFEDHKESNWWKPTLDNFVAHLQNGDTVLDVGCGAGIVAKYLHEKGLTVVGVDLSEEQVKIAREHVPEGTFTALDILSPDALAALPSFKGILAKAVFLHIPKDKVLEVMQRLNEHLERGGYFAVHLKEKQPDGPDEEVLRENDYGYEYERYFSYYTLPEVAELFRRCGLKIVSQEVLRPTKTSWVIVLGRK